MNRFIKVLSICTMLLWYTTTAMAQTTQIATLFHGGEITNFTSATGLSEALAAATDGDVITLSSGQFQSVDITKNVTIRGAGMGYPELGGAPNPTILTGNFKIDCQDSDANHLYLEGLVNNETITITKANGLNVLKCQLNEIDYDSPKDQWNNFRFIHCIISELSSCSTASIQFVNCAITNNFKPSSDVATSSYQLDNCVVYSESSISRSSMTNSILVFIKPYSYVTNRVNKDSSLTNSIIVGCDKFEAFDHNNKFYTYGQQSLIFTTDGFYTLTDEAKAFAGTDGGEVGIHGGSMPFTPETGGLKITKFKVAERTTADGKLPIEINIESK